MGQGDPLSFQGLKPWGTNLDSEKPHVQSGPNGSSPQSAKVVPIKQHYYTGEINFYLRLPDQAEKADGTLLPPFHLFQMSLSHFRTRDHSLLCWH